MKCQATSYGPSRFRCCLPEHPEHPNAHYYIGVDVPDGKHDDEAVDQ